MIDGILDIQQNNSGIEQFDIAICSRYFIFNRQILGWQDICVMIHHRPTQVMIYGNLYFYG